MTLNVTYCSDLHLEFGTPRIKGGIGSGDVLVLAGDITLPHRLTQNKTDASSRKVQARTKKFIESTKGYNKVLFVMGNHEHYHGLFGQTKEIMRGFVNQYADNWVILDNDTVKIGDITFVGSTLWTSFNNENPLAMYHAERSMMDYNLILLKDPIELTYTERHNHRLAHAQACITPLFTVGEHRFSWNYIKMVTGETGKMVVITHHPITQFALNNSYGPSILDAAYYTDYVNWLVEKNNITHWISGHTHSPMDVIIGNTRCLSNPLGYPMEPIYSRFELKRFEV